MEYSPLYFPLAVAGFIIIYKLHKIWQPHGYLDDTDVNIKCIGIRTAQNIDKMWHWIILARYELCLCDCK